MKQIFVKIQLFDVLQNVLVFEDNNLINTIQVNFAKLPETLCLIAKENQINEINIKGSKTYAKEIEQKTKEIEYNKYQNNNLIFNYI